MFAVIVYRNRHAIACNCFVHLDDAKAALESLVAFHKKNPYEGGAITGEIVKDGILYGIA